MTRYILLVIALFSTNAHAYLSAIDDTGAAITLRKPAQRIVSLAPHATELLFAAGGGDHLVGTVRFSDFPPAARTIPRVGDNLQVDLEKIVALKPDLLVVWRHNASERQIEQLHALGIPLYYSEPQKVGDIPDALLRLGHLMGTGQQAERGAAEFRRQLNELAARYSHRPPVRVFYQVWDKPLSTLNDKHAVSDAIRLCGGQNVFGHMATSVPGVSPEAVLQENPEAIITGARRDADTGGAGMWKQFPSMLAVRRNNLFAVDADLMHRPGPRIIQGAAELCERLELARQRRGDRK